MIRTLLVLFLASAALLSCNRKEMAVVSGTVRGTENKHIQIYRVEIGSVVPLDTSRIGSGGKFRFRIPAAQPEYYQIGYSDADFVTLIVHPGDNIRITFNGQPLSSDYNVDGSDESEMIMELEARLTETRREIIRLSAVWDSLSLQTSSGAAADSVDNLINEVITEQRNYSIDFVLRNLNSMVSILALYQKLNEETYVLYSDRDLQLMKLVSDSLTARFPSSLQVKALAEDFRREMGRFQSRQLQQLAQSIEPTELDPNLLTPSGKRVSLSSLRGKHVLLSFWSTASADCMQNNLQLKEIYNIYRSRGFEIYQINIDADTTRWKNAIQFDELPWISVREDDPAKLKYAYYYNVQAVPANYLYDPQGEIIATNLFGRTLAIKLEQIFGR